jgi:hypothetical protein
MQQLLATGALSKLPEEVQWNVRVLLMRRNAAPPAAASQTDPNALELLVGLLNNQAAAVAPVCATCLPPLQQISLCFSLEMYMYPPSGTCQHHWGRTSSVVVRQYGTQGSPSGA